MKYSTLYFHAGEIRKKLAHIKRMYIHNCKPKATNYDLLLQWSPFLVGLCKIICVLITAVGLLMILRPLVIFLVMNERVMMVPVWIPWVDETTSTGYTILTAYHVFVCVLAVVGTIGSDTMLIMLVVYLWPMTEIFDQAFKVINEAVEVKSFRKSSELKMFIRNVIQMHDEICSFNSSITNIYFIQCTVEVNTNGLSLCACIFCILTVSIYISQMIIYSVGLTFNI